MNECLFCNFINGTITTKIIDENDHVVAFDDIKPQAPIHFLIIPKIHITTMNDLSKINSFYLSEMFLMAKKISIKKNISKNGYRCIINTGKNGGQTIYHIHLHVLGGRTLSWPPG